MTRRPRVLMISPFASREATGEAFVAFRWAEMLAPHVDLTLMAFESPGHTPLARQAPGMRVLAEPLPEAVWRMGAVRRLAKPEWPIMMRRVRRHLAAEGDAYDLGHQVMPLGMRYPSPFRGGSLPYVIGPVGGALPTPPGLRGEMGRPSPKERLRGLDEVRLRRDPWLRGSYAGAALVLGVAPYARDRLVAADLAPARFETVIELGIDGVAGPRRPVGDGRVRLLHVGRGVRTKGLRDVIRAMIRLDDPRLHLTSAGDGPEIAACRDEAERGGLGDRVRFLGLVPRAAVEDLYATSDAFVFPSFREPTGNVVYEAMRWGLPIVAADYGGPAAILDDRCAVMVPPTDPEAFVAGIADGIRRIRDDPEAAAAMGERARAKVAAEGLWSAKAERVAALYRSVMP